MSTITTRYLGDMLFESELDTHRLQIDVPHAMGGSDRGPMPPQVFIASLGSCIAAFVANYCHQCGIDTTDLSVDVSFEKQDGRLTNLQATIHLPHADCGGRMKSVQRAAEQCIIHETMATFEGLQVSVVDKVMLNDGVPV